VVWSNLVANRQTDTGEYITCLAEANMLIKILNPYSLCWFYISGFVQILEKSGKLWNLK